MNHKLRTSFKGFLINNSNSRRVDKLGYRIETRTFEELQGKLNLPNFQRALVWSNNQKKSFLILLKMDFPLVLFCCMNTKEKKLKIMKIDTV